MVQLTKVRGRVQKKPRHQPPRPERAHNPKPPPVDLDAIEGRALRTRGMALLNRRAHAWRRLDRLKNTEL